MNSSEQINELSTALSKMQSQMGPAKKDKVNPFFKSFYADLTSIWNAIREPLTENGLAVVQDAIASNDCVSISTRVMHSSGQWIEFGPLVMPISKRDAQCVGSAISYAKRYALGATFGIVSEIDDDGNKALKPRQNDQEKINKDQILSLKEIFKEKPEIEGKILTWAKISCIEDLPVNLYETAIKSAKKVSHA